MLLNQLGLYVHFPYCNRRCPYCDFTLTTSAIPHEQYLQAVLSELTSLVDRFAPFPSLTSLYIGGGTPGLWNPKSLNSLVDTVDHLIGFHSNAELTLEANPAELTLSLAKEWKHAGFNRLSLGIQSFSADTLIRLGRTHNPDEARQAVGWARIAGFDNLNIDLIHGLHGQGVTGALEDLKSALAVDPEHISLYQLTIEPQTQFGARAKRGERLNDPEELLTEEYIQLSKALSIAGRPLYEVSNAARPGRESKHNQLYWKGAQYLGVGTGAHGLIQSRNQPQYAWRWQNIRKPSEYIKRALMKQSVTEETSLLDEVAICEEKVLVGLRLTEGLKASPQMKEKYGQRALQLVAEGLLSIQGDQWYATSKGRLLLDHLTTRLLID